MREERGGKVRPLGQVEPRGKLVAVMALEGEAFGGHGLSPLSGVWPNLGGERRRFQRCARLVTRW